MRLLKSGIIGVLVVVALVWATIIAFTNIDSTELRIVVDHGWEYAIISLMLVSAYALSYWDT